MPSFIQVENNLFFFYNFAPISFEYLCNFFATNIVCYYLITCMA
jgi:hypothetical protein